MLLLDFGLTSSSWESKFWRKTWPKSNCSISMFLGEASFHLTALGKGEGYLHFHGVQRLKLQFEQIDFLTVFRVVVKTAIGKALQRVSHSRHLDIRSTPEMFWRQDDLDWEVIFPTIDSHNQEIPFHHVEFPINVGELGKGDVDDSGMFALRTPNPVIGHLQQLLLVELRDLLVLLGRLAHNTGVF